MSDSVFKDHRASYSVMRDGQGHELERLYWAKPGTSVYSILYLRYRNRLYVCGDLFEAIYGWSEVVTLKWISGLNLDYFASKCEASENGRGYKEWSPEKAEKMVMEILSETPEKLEQFAGYSGSDYLGRPEEWHAFLNDHGHDIFGPDWWEMGGIGRLVSKYCRLHLEGLKQAMARLEDSTGSISEAERLFQMLHAHPGEECRLGLDGDHVIVDRAAFESVRKFLGSEQLSLANQEKET